MWAVTGERVFTALMAQADADEDVNWAVSVDSTIVRAHPKRRGADSTGQALATVKCWLSGRSDGERRAYRLPEPTPSDRSVDASRVQALRAGVNETIAGAESPIRERRRRPRNWFAKRSRRCCFGVCVARARSCSGDHGPLIASE